MKKWDWKKIQHDIDKLWTEGYNRKAEVAWVVELAEQKGVIRRVWWGEG